jgi:hypothetical protein
VKVGARVGCWLSIVGKSGLFLGWGTYVGEEVPPNEGHSSLSAYLSGLRQTNPKIVLDSGDVVWGCECWWGPEEQVKAERAKMEKVIDITMAEARLGKIPEGFETHWGPQGEPSTDDFFGNHGSGQGKDFWS